MDGVAINLPRCTTCASLMTYPKILPQCPICASLMTDPKTLSCWHTFCEACLTNLLSLQDQVAPESVVCPLCCSDTDVKDGNVSGLRTNESLKSRAQNIKDNGVPCDVCTNKAKAVEYCCDCNKSICKTCRKKHDEWKPNTTHQVLDMDDIIKAKDFPRKAVWCIEHTDMTEVCITCKKYLCTRCSITDHEKEGHEVKRAKEYDAAFKDNFIRLQKEAESKTSRLTKYIDVVEKEKQKSLKHIDAVIEESKRKLRMSVERPDEEMTVRDERCNDDRKLNEQLDRIKAAGKLVEKSSKVQLHEYDEDTVVIRDSLCKELKAVLKSASSLSNAVTRNQELGTTEIGKVQFSEWKPKANVALSTANAMTCLAATPNGRMAVGCAEGEHGIEIYSADGQLQQTVLKGVAVHGIGFLSDGRCVVRDTGNTDEVLSVSLYTRGWEKVDARFETLSWDDGGHGNLTVDSKDHIYVGYMKAKKIQVFSQAGGKPVREIKCTKKKKPQQIFMMNTRNIMVVLTHKNSARTMDPLGNRLTIFRGKCINKSKESHVCPAVCKDDTILIATVNKERDRVIIERYTSELKRVATLITDHVIQKPVDPDRDYYCIQEFTSGEIAFCTTDRLYIFSNAVTPAGV